MKSLEKLLALALVAGCGANQNSKQTPDTGNDGQDCPECNPDHNPPPPAAASSCVRVNLASDSRDLAQRVDADLVNSWGLERGDASFVIANNGTGKVSILDREGAPVVEGALRSGALDLGEGITGVVRVRLDLFSLTAQSDTMGDHPDTTHAMADCDGGTTTSSFARYIFATEDGKLIAVDPNLTDAKLQQKVIYDSAGAAKYTGVAVIGDRIPSATSMTPDHTTAGDISAARILAADFKGGKIDVFDATFAAVPCGTGSSAKFVDPNMVDGYSPFNVAVLDNRVFVTYAKVGANGDEEAGAGLGMISEFKTDGTFVRRIATAGALDAPWGMAMAPQNFCSADSSLSADLKVLLVGNFGDGHLIPIDVSAKAGTDDTGTPDNSNVMGALVDDQGALVVIDGLWGIMFGNDKVGLSTSLYFAAGPADEAHGLFGRLDAKAVTPGGGSGSGSGYGH